MCRESMLAVIIAMGDPTHQNHCSCTASGEEEKLICFRQSLPNYCNDNSSHKIACNRANHRQKTMSGVHISDMLEQKVFDLPKIPTKFRKNPSKATILVFSDMGAPRRNILLLILSVNVLQKSHSMIWEG